MPKKKFLADPTSKSPDAFGNRFKTLVVKISSRPDYLFRTMLSKLLYTKEIFTEEDEVLLFQSFEKVVSLCAKEKSYREKNLFLTFFVRNIFLNLSCFVEDDLSKQELREQLDQIFSHGRKQLSASIYYGYKGLKDSVEMKIFKPRKPRAKNRIAVGYRDKGNARNTAWDGSPPWQEIASDFEIQLTVDSQGWRDRETELYEDLKSFGKYRWQIKPTPKRPSKLVTQMRG